MNQKQDPMFSELEQQLFDREMAGVQARMAYLGWSFFLHLEPKTLSGKMHCFRAASSGTCDQSVLEMMEVMEGHQVVSTIKVSIFAASQHPRIPPIHSRIEIKPEEWLKNDKKISNIIMEEMAGAIRAQHEALVKREQPLLPPTLAVLFKAVMFDMSHAKAIEAEKSEASDSQEAENPVNPG